jgi:hypothetical protein
MRMSVSFVDECRLVAIIIFCDSRPLRKCKIQRAPRLDFQAA